jgi:hypothetical protein
MFHLSLQTRSAQRRRRQTLCALGAVRIRFYVVITHQADHCRDIFARAEMPTADVLGCDLQTDGLFHGEPARRIIFYI